MFSAFRSNLHSLSERPSLAGVVASLKALPWPGPVQQAARRGMDCLARRLPFLAELLEPKPPPPRPRTPRRTRPAPRKAPADGVAALVTALRGPDPEPAAEAAKALGAHRSPRARAALLEALENRDGYFSPVTRVAAVRALATHLGDGDDTALSEAVRDIDPDVSLAAITALTEAGGDGAIAVLSGIVADETAFVLPASRRAAARGLATLRGGRPGEPR